VAKKKLMVKKAATLSTKVKKTTAPSAVMKKAAVKTPSISPAEKQKRATYILKKLGELYPNPKPPLDHDDPFTLLIAVLLSAQTTDVRVNLVTPALFKQAHSPQKMAKLSVAEILSFVKSVNYGPTKAKNIKRLSEILIENFAGEVPRNFEGLESLPGVGHKTASVVMSQCFGVPAFPVDTHIHRLATKWKLTSGKNVEQTETDLKSIFPESTWNALHLQIIFYGREHCSARGCDGRSCEICKKVNPQLLRIKNTDER
jgi:endonuclease-3